MLYPGRASKIGWAMPDNVLESYIQQYIQSQPQPVIHFAWQGGEPTLLGVDFFQKAVQLQGKYADGKRIENGFQTNGILIDDAWGEFLAAHHFLIGLSIDGPQGIHDHYRVDKGNQPTFEKVMRGLRYLQKHGVEFNTLTVVQRHNSCRPQEVYRFLKEIGSQFMQFIPIVERIAEPAPHNGLLLVSPAYAEPARIAEWSVESAQYGKFLCAIFDEWVRSDVGRYFVQLFDVALEAWMGMEPSLCVFRRICGEAMAIEHNGDLYSCDHYVYPENRLGNILENPLLSLARSPQQQKFGQDKLATLPAYCQRCNFRFTCNGECPKHRFIHAPGGEKGLNYLCAAYKMFFKHVDPYMKFMAQQLRQNQAPANVMRWVREQDLRAAGRSRPGRNDPCLCGSGRKYKKCCGRGESDFKD
jgi:uncharacterized protein